MKEYPTKLEYLYYTNKAEAFDGNSRSTSFGAALELVFTRTLLESKAFQYPYKFINLTEGEKMGSTSNGKGSKLDN